MKYQQLIPETKIQALIVNEIICSGDVELLAKSRNRVRLKSYGYEIVQKDNNTIIKLPKNYIEESLELSFEFLQSLSSRNKKIIDVRVKDQIILND